MIKIIIVCGQPVHVQIQKCRLKHIHVFVFLFQLKHVFSEYYICEKWAAFFVTEKYWKKWNQNKP